MARLRDLLGYNTYVVRSDGAKFVNGVRNDNADTSWLSYSNSVLTLGPGLYDELLFQRRFASDEEIVAWHKAGAFHDASQRIGGTVIEDGAITTRHIQADSITAESGIIKSLDIGKATTGQLRVTPKPGQGASGIVLDDGAADRIHIGNIGGRPWGEGQLPANTFGIHGELAGVYMRGYARLLDAGYAEDEEEIDLSDFGPLGDVEILVAPKDLVTYSPERDTVSRMYVDTVKESDTLYVVKAKVMVEGQEHIWGGRSDTRDSWTYTRPTDSTGGKKGVFTDFIICRPTWWVSGGGFGAYTARLWMDITNEFNQAGDPINWQTVRTFSRSSAGSGTLNWDRAVEFGQWAVRVRGQGGGSLIVDYAKTGLNRLGYRSDTTYLDRDGNIITDPNPGEVSSGMSVLYVVLDRG